MPRSASGMAAFRMVKPRTCSSYSTVRLQEASGLGFKGATAGRMIALGMTGALSSQFGISLPGRPSGMLPFIAG